jgi:hypothetical protein
MAESMKNAVFWDVTPCGSYKVFTTVTQRNIPEDTFFMSTIVCFLSCNEQITIIDAVALKISPAKLCYNLIYFFCQIIPCPEINICFLHI